MDDSFQHAQIPSADITLPPPAATSLNAFRPPLPRSRRTHALSNLPSSPLSNAFAISNTPSVDPSLSIIVNGAIPSRTPSRQSTTSNSSSFLHRTHASSTPSAMDRDGTPTVTRMRSAKDTDLSMDTRLLLKNMMHSSRLTYSQQRFLDLLVNDSRSLPAHPSSNMHSSSSRATPVPGATTPSVSGSTPLPNASTSTAISSSKPSQHPRQRMAARAAELAEWISRPGIRTLDQIKLAGAYDQESYRTRPMKDMLVEKSRYQDKLEGIDAPKDTFKKTGHHGRSNRGQSHDTDHHTTHEDDLDEFEMIQQEIMERRQWLDDMIALGRGDQFKRQIQSEIAQRVSRLEQIHKERLKQETSASSSMIGASSSGSNKASTSNNTLLG